MVIGIVGVIMALATVAYSTTQISGRNARRKQDLVAIQNALELYYSQNSFKYPNGSCKVASTYMRSAWPIDPGTDLDYSGVDICVDTGYCVCGVMEGTSTMTGNAGPNCDFSSGSRIYYCVANLQ